MKCANCGKEVPEKAKACGYCGTKVEKPAPVKKAPKKASPVEKTVTTQPSKIPGWVVSVGIVVVAVALAVFWFTSRSPSPPEAAPFSAAVGYWEATDVDGSAMRLQVIENPDGSFDVTIHDDGASVCGYDESGESLLSYNGRGTGTAQGYVYNVHEVGSCEGSGEEFEFDYHITYDPEEDTLTDSEEITWYRE